MWYYWSRFNELTVEDSILCLRTPVGDGREISLRAIVPRAAQQEILELAHGSRVGGHLGVQTTVENLSRYFPGLKLLKTSSAGAKTVQPAFSIKLTRETVVSKLQFTLEHHLSAPR